MISHKIVDTLKLLGGDKNTRFISAVVFSFSLILTIFVSFVSGFTVFAAYILGYVASVCIYEYQSIISIYLEKLLNFYNVRGRLRKLRPSCSVCDDLSCRRHQMGKNGTPWKHLHIHKDLNNAVEHFYNRILSNFVLSWHKEFTENKGFPNELRYCIKYASANVVNRILSVNVADVIASKLVPQGIKHIDDYLYMQQIAKLKNVNFDSVMVEYLGKNLHVATTNRKNELTYLSHLSAELLKFLLPKDYIGCRNYAVLLREILSGWVLLPLMDVLADPNIINALVILAVNYKSNKHLRTENFKQVEFLENFVQIDPSKKSPFAINLNKIKKDTDLLYAFMQFLKRQEQVYFLQFCLDVDDFNNRLLTPDLSKKQLEKLHSQATNLYKEYLNKDSYNFIGCSKTICDEYNNLIKDIYSVAKLRTSKPLYLAYDFAFNTLESVWLPQFFHSNEFYNIICGSKIMSTYSKAPIKSGIPFGFGSPVRSKKYYEQSANYGPASKLGTSLVKIKGVLKSGNPVDGSLDPLDAQALLYDNGGMMMEEGILSSADNLIRDMNSWRVRICEYKTDPVSKITSFCLNVQKQNSSVSESDRIIGPKIWRKDQDFFTLKAKLVEFHGEDEICDSPLPSRKMGSSVEVRMHKYEKFISSLLKKPSLRGSDLLYTFLTVEENFSLVIATMAPTQDIGNIYQSMAHKLRKEKGQHLDAFMATFMSSVVQQKQDKLEPTEEAEELLENDPLNVNKELELPRTYPSHVFKDNLGIKYRPVGDSSCSSISPAAFSECLFYLLKNIFKIPSTILKLYVVICSVAQQLVDLVSKIIIDRKLRSGLCQENLAYLIGLLEEVIFDHAHVPLTKQEQTTRKEIAFEKINFCPTSVNRILGGKMNEGLVTMLEALQNPYYNKQLAYTLLDIIILDLFPELDQSTESETFL